MIERLGCSASHGVEIGPELVADEVAGIGGVAVGNRIVVVTTTEASAAQTTEGVAPQDAIVIAANSPFVWYSGSGITNPFLGDVTKTVWSCPGTTGANLNVRTLQTA